MKYRHIALLTALTLLCGCSGNIPAESSAVSEPETQTAESAAPEIPDNAETTEPAESVESSKSSELTSEENAGSEIFRLNGDWCEPEELPLKITRYSPSESSAHPELWEYTNGEKILKSNITIRHITADGRMILLQQDFPDTEQNAQYMPETISTIYSLDPAADELKTLYSGEMTAFVFSDEYCAGFRFTDDSSVFKVVSLDTGEAFEPQLDVEYTFLGPSESMIINDDDVIIDGTVRLPITNGIIYTSFRYNIPEQTWAVYNTPYPAEHDEQSVYYGWNWRRPDGSYEGIEHYPDEIMVNTCSYFRTKVVESGSGGKNSQTVKYTANNGADIEIGSTDISKVSSVCMTRDRLFLIALGGEHNDLTFVAGLSRPGSDRMTAALLSAEEYGVEQYSMDVTPDRIWLYNYGTLDSMVLTLE